MLIGNIKIKLYSTGFINFLNVFIFREGEGREKERERNIDQLPLAHTPNGDQARNSGMCLDQESNL